MKKIMMIGVGWEQLPMVKKAKEMGLKVIVTSTYNEITKWLSDDIETYMIESRDLNALEKLFCDVKPDAILADECDYSMYAVAFLTEKYNLPGPSLKALTITNNKYLQREIAKIAKIKQPKHRLVWDLEQALHFVSDLEKYPVILKPVDNRGSIGVCKINNKDELKKYWYVSVANSNSRCCIIEEYYEGDIITVDAFCDSKKLNIISFSSKESYEDDKTVAKKLFFPGKLKINEEEIFKALEMFAIQADINFGFIHAEFLVNNDDYRLVEVANRGGGVHISNIILPELAQVDLVKGLINMSLGKEFIFKHNREFKSKIEMYFFEVLESGTKDAEKIFENNKEVLAIYSPAMSVALNNQIGEGAKRRKGVIIAKGEEFDIIESNLLDIEKQLKITTNEIHCFR